MVIVMHEECRNIVLKKVRMMGVKLKIQIQTCPPTEHSSVHRIAAVLAASQPLEMRTSRSRRCWHLECVNSRN